MIFVTVGSQKFQFDRLLMKVDELIEKQIIQETVFAQTGYCDYMPRFFEYTAFMETDAFADMEGKADLVITHGGTGAILGAVKKGKKVIAVPRRKKYKEHVDDHQIQILEEFDRMGVIKACYELEDLGKVYREIQDMSMQPYHTNTVRIINSIDNFLNQKSEKYGWIHF